MSSAPEDRGLLRFLANFGFGVASCVVWLVIPSCVFIALAPINQYLGLGGLLISMGTGLGALAYVNGRAEVKQWADRWIDDEASLAPWCAYAFALLLMLVLVTALRR